jgi:hypothetical protein
MEYYDWEDDMEDFFWGCGLESVVKIYYAEETSAKDAFDLVAWWTWRDIKVVLRHQFALPRESRKKVAAARGPKSLATKLVDSSKKMKKEDSLMAEVPEPIITHGSTDFSLGSGLHPSASSCDT